MDDWPFGVREGGEFGRITDSEAVDLDVGVGCKGLEEVLSQEPGSTGEEDGLWRVVKGVD